jgi:thymidylate synthase
MQLTREPYPFPTVTIQEIRENINDYQVEDFVINNYQHHPQIKFQMVA